jgi:large subunit ribosomal protein L23
MEATHVIKKPLVTEKGTWAMNEQNRYSFEVDVRASKVDIKQAIESLYKVKVEKVNTRVCKGHQRRLRYGLVITKAVKTAQVRLKEGNRIELF